ncbi:hypothetical protein EI94DRAFT_1812645 [Lactarius quietus]|nr:hypothetical protein EI94DRAFT_1812645 [Lactarius quietus]
MIPPTETIPALSPAPDPLAAAWDKVKDGPKGDSGDGRLDVTTPRRHKAKLPPFTPLMTAVRSEIGKAVKEGIDHFFDGIPVLMNALDEVKTLHPFIGVVVLAFKAAYTLEQKRSDNEKKIIALYVEMKDMMGALLAINVLKALFEQLVSPEQKQLAATVAANGGVKALRNNDRILLTLEKTTTNAPSVPSAEGQRKPGDANPTADNLRTEIFEDPDVAVKKNQAVYFRKFEAQKRQIIDELTFVVRRESDRVIQEMKGGPHERIRDRTIYEIWAEMGWRGSVKARHFVLALRNHYLEKLAAEVEGVPGMLANNSRNTDVWAIKFIDATRLQPILEAFDDDASGFITISEMNRFSSSRPRDWRDFDEYFSFGWTFVHTLTAATAVTSLESELVTSNLGRFRSYLEAEEDRLSTNLRAVDYIIDGTDTLVLITGVGRIEKTVFPLIYLLLKRHYEIMRTMRSKVLDSRELGSGLESLVKVKAAIRCRMNDLTNVFSHQKLDPEKQLQNFAFGIYFRNEKDLWSSDYVRNLNPPVIPYDDTNEDQNFKMTFQKFQSVSWSAFFEGRFDAARDALTGVWGFFEELSDNKPRALWRFAIAAVRDDVRRTRWSWSYFARRRKDRQTVLSLGIRDWFFGTPINDEEAKLSATQSHIPGTRERLDTETFDTLDLCSAQECMAARIAHRQDLRVVHEPSRHRLIKVRTVVLKRQHGRVHTAALAAFERVQTLYPKIAEAPQRSVQGQVTVSHLKNPGHKEALSEPGGVQLAASPEMRSRSQRR